jgi:hypothetical protein
MNKEQQELLDEAYKNYNKEILRQRELQKKEVERLRSQGKRVRISLIELLSKEEFIEKCKTDQEFSEKWGLKIKERELSLEERIRMYALKEGQTYEEFVTNWNTDEQWSEDLSDATIPTRLITITYNNKTIESYE